MESMKRFVLLFKLSSDQHLQALIDEYKREHTKDHDCSQCAGASICPVNNNTALKENALGITHNEDFLNLKHLIDIFYPLSVISFMILIDSEKDILYVYKAQGHMSEIRKTSLPHVIRLYEIATDKSDVCFDEIRDLRVTMGVKNHGMN